jgi:hypothetical protein
MVRTSLVGVHYTFEAAVLVVEDGEHVKISMGRDDEVYRSKSRNLAIV